MNYVDHLDLFGVEAKQIPCSTGVGAPATSTEGAVGCLYMDTVTGDVYKCVGVSDGVYMWKSISPDSPGIMSCEPRENDIPKIFIDGDIPSDKTDVLAEMHYISKTKRFHAYIKIKAQGNSSLWYPKKNFTVKLYSDVNREIALKEKFKDWGYETNKYVLKANYIDHTHARNIVSARLWDEVVSSRSDYDALPPEIRTSPRNGAVDGFPIKVYTNGVYQGLYTWNIGKDAWMWGMDEGNPNHLLLCGETNDNGTFAEKAASFRAMWTGVDNDNWSIEVGENREQAKTSLNNLINFVMNNDGDAFKAGIGQYLDVQSALDYYLFSYAICGVDNLAKNLLLGTYDGVKWYCGQYDLDSTFGLHVGGTLISHSQYRCPEDYQEKYSLLWERIEANYCDELVSRYSELRAGPLSLPNIVTGFERFTDVIGDSLYAEDLTIYTEIPSGETNNISQVRKFILDRLQYVDKQIIDMRFGYVSLVSDLVILGGYVADATIYEPYANKYVVCGVRSGAAPYLLSKTAAEHPDGIYSGIYPIAIPLNAARIMVTAPDAEIWLDWYKYDAATNKYQCSGRYTACSAEEGYVVDTIDRVAYDYVSVHLERPSAFPEDYDYSKVKVEFATST